MSEFWKLIAFVFKFLVSELKRFHSMLGLKSLRTATLILIGIGSVHMIKKGQFHQEVKSAQNTLEFIHKLFEYL